MPALRSTATIALAAACLLAPATALADPPADLPQYEVGVARRSIAVGDDGTYAGKPVYLGGYGIGGPSAAGPGLGDRHATGNLGVGPSVRAIVIGDGKDAVAVADIEGQGWFAATKDGPLGLEDMRKAAAKELDGAIPADHVIIQSDHSHGGPDFMGVWGGTPTEYRQFAFSQTVAAIKAAWQDRQSGSLWYGTAPGRDLLSNQFGYDAANKVMDSDVRVLQLRDAKGHRPLATLLNFSAHSTVLGSDNTLATGDWPQQANLLMEARDKDFGDKAMTMVGTLGRTQPADRGCPDASIPDGTPARDLCSLDAYAGRVVARARDAIETSRPLTGSAQVAASSYLVSDPGSSPLLLGMLYGGAALGIPVNRSMLPPFMTGNVIGTVTATARIGDVLLSAGPGEMYPQIPLKVRGTMEQLTAGVRGYMTAGLANDQLGYLIAPYESYPEPIRRSFFDNSFPNGDVLGACPANPGADTCNPGVSPIDNDNYFFNVSHTMGERVTCSLLRGAGELFGVGDQARAAYDRCQVFGNDAALPEGSDLTLSDATAGAPAIPSSIPPGGLAAR